MANTISLMTNAVRGVVSKKRIRYQENGYDLDLTYVCPNLIAMGYPAENIESIFRNKIEHVCHFFEEKHKDRYKIYNLCSERNYNRSKFHGRVAVYPFDDHNPPPIRLIKEFCDDVDTWLKADENNVAAVHCKAGKGRTGTMICCYLLHCHMKTTAEDALTYYDEKRTKNKKGVTIPSQRRYVEYYAKLLNSGQPYEDRTVQICEIKFSTSLSNQDNVYCSIFLNPRSEGETESNVITLNFRKTQIIEITDRCIPLTGDVKIEVYRKVMKKKEKYFHFWFNTFFICDSAAYDEGSDKKLLYELSKYELDDAHKDTEHKTVPQDFKVQLVFKPVPRHQTTLNDNYHLRNNHVATGQNHCNQLPNNLHNSSQTMITNNLIGPAVTTRSSSSSGEQLLPTAIEMNCQNRQGQLQMQQQQQQQQLHRHQQNQKYHPQQQAHGNSVTNPTKRKTLRNNDNQHSNDRETFSSSSSSSSNLVVGRGSSVGGGGGNEEVLSGSASGNGSGSGKDSRTTGVVARTTKTGQTNAIRGSSSSNTSNTIATGAGLNTPSVSSDVSRTNSSSRSSSINSEEASSNGGGDADDNDEDWESGESIRSKRKEYSPSSTSSMLMAMMDADDDDNVTHSSIPLFSHSMIMTMSSSNGNAGNTNNCNSLLQENQSPNQNLNLANDTIMSSGNDNSNLNNNNGKSSMDLVENANASNISDNHSNSNRSSKSVITLPIADDHDHDDRKTDWIRKMIDGSDNIGATATATVGYGCGTNSKTTTKTSKLFGKSLGVHNTISSNNATKKLQKKRRWLLNMKSDPDLREVLANSVSFRKLSISSSVGGGGDCDDIEALLPQIDHDPELSCDDDAKSDMSSNRTRNYSTTEHDENDFYSSLCDKQLSFGGTSPMKSPRVTVATATQSSLLRQTKLKSPSTGATTVVMDKPTANNVVVAKPIKSHSIGFRVAANDTEANLKPPASWEKSECLEKTAANQSKKSKPTIGEYYVGNNTSNPILSPSAAAICEDIRTLALISSSPPACKANRCVPFSFRSIRQELHAVLTNRVKSVRNSGKITDNRNGTCGGSSCDDELGRIKPTNETSHEDHEPHPSIEISATDSTSNTITSPNKEANIDCSSSRISDDDSVRVANDDRHCNDVDNNAVKLARDK